MKLFTILFCALCIFGTKAAYASGGEGENAECNGVGNPNSYCDGTEETPTECPVPPPPTPVVHNHVCVIPVQAATAFLTTSNFYFNSDAKTCARQCKTVAKTCSGVAKAQGKCYAGLIRGQARFSLANCKTVTDKLLRAQCVWNVRHNSGENLEIFAANTATATAICKDTVQNCVAACQE